MKKHFSGLTRDTFLLALVSLFADISAEMLYPILPIYLTQNLKAGGSIVGLVEGLAGAAQNIIQGLSGSLSDKLNRRKPIALLGYTLSALAKPLIGFSSVWQQVLGARFLERLGSGTRSAPRDALIASSVNAQNRGRAFGLEGIGDNLGAFLGPLLTLFLLSVFLTDIRSIFYLAFIPGVLAVFATALVREKPSDAEKEPTVKRGGQFPVLYWKYLGVTALFGLGNFSNSFLILQTRSIGASLPSTILIYALFNLVAALISYPSGFLSDKLGRKKILLGAFFIFAITYSGFALTTSLYFIAILFVFYGLFQGIFRTVGKSLATDLVTGDLRASGVGWYSTTVGLSGLISSITAGLLWDRAGHPVIFAYGAAFAAAGIIALIFLLPKRSHY